MQNVEYLLNFILSNDIIDSETMANMQKKYLKKGKDYLNKHKYKIFKGADGRWYTRIPLKEGGSKQIVRKTKKELEKSIEQYYIDLEDNPTIRELFEKSEEEKLKRHKICSTTYQRNRMIFKKYYDEFGEKKICDLTVMDIVEFIENCVYEMNLTAKGYSKVKGVLIEVLRYASRKGVIEYTFESVKSKLDISENELEESKMTDETEVYNEEETRKLKDYLSCSTKPHDLALCLFLFTGLRIGEMSALKWEDYDGQRLIIHRMERTEYKMDGKGKKRIVLDGKTKTKYGVRAIPLTDGAISILEKMKNINPDGEYIFEDESGRRISSENIRKRLITVCKQLDIQYKPPHKMRKTFLTLLLDNGMSPSLVSDIAGHSSPQTTLEYYKFKRASDDTIRNEYDKIGSELRL